MTSSDRARTLARLRRAELAPLFTELRSRYENADVVRTVTLARLTDTELGAVTDLLGFPSRPALPVQVKVADLDRVLTASPLGCDTRTAVELVGGPIVSRAAQRAAARDERQQLWRWLEQHPQVTAEPALQRWVAATRRAGIHGDVATTRRLLEQALKVLAALPSDGRPLPRFATDVLGDAHALDPGPLANSVLRAIALLTGDDMRAATARRRHLWATVGVACDALSSTVLLAGFRPPGSGPTAASLTVWADRSHAAHLTLAQLHADPLTVPDGETVWAVENPSVVHAALQRFGDRCPPLLCTSGWPSVAATAAIRQLTDEATTVRYHGDIDAAGLTIAAWLADKTGAVPWRLTTGDYLACVPDDAPDPGDVPHVPWDADLADTVRTRGRAQLEEAVVTRLLDDLAATSFGHDPAAPRH